MKENVNIEQDEILTQFSGVYFWNEDGEIPSFINFDRLEELTGYSLSEFKKFSDGWNTLISLEDLPRYRKALDEFGNSPQKDMMEVDYKITKKDGTIIHLLEKIQAIRNDDGSILNRSGVLIDITNYKEKLAQYRSKAEQLELLNSAKDNFISILSHDLRAPFTSILGFAEIILNETSLPEKDKVEYIKFIYDSSNNQLQLINHLFDWSQIQTGRVKFELQRLHPQSIAHNCVSYLTGLAMRKNININVKIPDSFYIDGDERYVTKVFMNLISNAIKYSHEDGTVEVSGNVYNEDFVEFVVRDKGVGISETNRERIFNIAKLFSTEGTKGEKGSGLGLTLSKQIVEKHKGNFWFYSNEGKGSEFHFTLPAATSYLLLVLDDANKLDEMQTELKKYLPNLEVLKTENAFEAMETIAVKSPSLAIIEHALPLMNGLQLVSTVRERFKQMKFPVIVFVDSDDLIKAYQEINVKILKQKPSFSESLKDKIEILLYG